MARTKQTVRKSIYSQNEINSPSSLQKDSGSFSSPPQVQPQFLAYSPSTFHYSGEVQPSPSLSDFGPQPFSSPSREVGINFQIEVTNTSNSPDLSAFGPQPGQAIADIVDQLNKGQNPFSSSSPSLIPSARNLYKEFEKESSPSQIQQYSIESLQDVEVQTENLTSEQSDLTKLLFLISHLQSNFSSDELLYLKKLVFKKNATLIAVLEAYEIEKNLNEFEESLHRIFALRIGQD